LNNGIGFVSTTTRTRDQKQHIISTSANSHFDTTSTSQPTNQPTKQQNMIDAIPENAPAGPHHPPSGGGGAAAANTAAAMEDDDDDDDNDINEEVAAARAAAEVETHGHSADNNARRGAGGGNANNVPADQAVMGAVQDNMGDGVANFEVTDESGSLVQQRFLQFLTD
jgi:hypothetical protein